MDSILTSIKRMLGIQEDYEHFDIDIILHINSVLMIVTQIGVGPAEGFAIEDKTAVWTDLTNDETMLNSVKSFVYLKVKLLFDPPANSAAMQSLKDLTSEFEWRLNAAAESNKPEGEEENQNGEQ
jgi:hypothetical protein